MRHQIDFFHFPGYAEHFLRLKIAAYTAFKLHLHKVKCHSIVSEMFILRNELSLSLNLFQT